MARLYFLLLHLLVLFFLILMLGSIVFHIKNSVNMAEARDRSIAVLVGFALVIGGQVTGVETASLLHKVLDGMPVMVLPVVGDLRSLTAGVVMIVFFRIPIFFQSKTKLNYIALIVSSLLFGLFVELYAFSFGQNEVHEKSRELLLSNYSFALGAALGWLLGPKKED